jgi:hypothetical protein
MDWMNLKRRNGPRAIAALVLFSIVQVGLQVGLAEPTVTTTAIPISAQVVGRLTTSNNSPIQVNGLSASTGASILSGATLETGADQTATVNLGPLGTVDIAPNTKLVLTFGDQGDFKALVTTGCVKVTARTNAIGEIATDQGSQGKTNPATGGVLEMCNQPGAAPVVGPGVAANAGVGAAAPSGAAAAGGGGLFGLGVPATIAIVAGGTAAGLTPLFFADDNQINPSGPSN